MSNNKLGKLDVKKKLSEIEKQKLEIKVFKRKEMKYLQKPQIKWTSLSVLKCPIIILMHATLLKYSIKIGIGILAKLSPVTTTEEV